MTYQQFIDYVWNTHYLKAVTIFIFAYIVMQILVIIFEKVFLRLAKKTKTIVDDLIVEQTKKPLAVLIMLIGARFASESLQFTKAANSIIVNIFNSLIVLMIAHIIVIVFNIIIDNWGKHLVSKTKSKIDDDLLIMTHRFAKVVLYLLAIIYILKIWGIEIGPLVASLGIAGIAVAFALQSTLGNIFGGVSLIMDKAIRVGDIVKLADGTLGVIEKVSIRSTKLKTFDNELITVPNGKLADEKITNWYMPDKKVRITVNFSTVYGSDLDKVKKLIVEIMKKDKGVQKDSEPYVLFKEMSDFSLNFMARFWIDDISEKLETKDRITTAIYKTLNKNKIGIPFPTSTVYVKKGK